MGALNEATPEQWDRAAKSKIVSDGGSAEYYQLPTWAKELDDLIVHKQMPWHIANIFKACYRYGEKYGHEQLYDANKILWFITKEIKDLQREAP